MMMNFVYLFATVGLIQGLKIGKGDKSPVRFILEEVIMDLKNANRLE